MYFSSFLFEILKARYVFSDSDISHEFCSVFPNPKDNNLAAYTVFDSFICFSCKETKTFPLIDCLFKTFNSQATPETINESHTTSGLFTIICII